MEFKYNLDDFENKNKEVWDYIEKLHIEEVCSLVDNFDDKSIKKGLYEVFLEKAKKLSVDEIDCFLERKFPTYVQLCSFNEIKKFSKTSLPDILYKIKYNKIKRQKENIVLGLFKEFFSKLSKEEKQILSVILYDEGVRFKKLRNEVF